MNQLTIYNIVRGAIAIGLENGLAILVNTVLWGLTAWIPYLNIGTTIGLFVGLPAKASRGEVFGPTEIFNSEYRQNPERFFLTVGLSTVGCALGYALFLVPGIVLALTWSLAPLLAADRGLESIDALKTSADLTRGKKAIIFGGYLLLQLSAFIATALLALIFNLISPLLVFVVAVLGLLANSVLTIGSQAYIYQQLTENSDDSPVEDEDL